jgi:hypothetical protein
MLALYHVISQFLCVGVNLIAADFGNIVRIRMQFKTHALIQSASWLHVEARMQALRTNKAA